MTQKLYVKCPECDEIVPTGIHMDEQSFKSSTLKNNTTNCNKCGAMINFSKEDIVNEKGESYKFGG